jgi:hypothetical protein
VYRGNKNNEGIHINLKVLVFLFLQVLNLLFFSFFFVKDIIVMV